MPKKISRRGLSLRVLVIAFLSLLLATPTLMTVAATAGSAQPTSGGGGIAIFAGCAVYGVASSLTGGKAAGLNWCFILSAIVYFATPITIAVIILIYELLLRIDIAGSAGGLINRILTRVGTKRPNLSILPSFKEKTDYQTEQDLFKIDNPLNIFINVNRAFLYIAFFLSFVTIWPMSGVFNFPSSAYIAIFAFINYFVVGFEPIFLTTLILVFAPVNIYVDVIVDAVNLVVD